MTCKCGVECMSVQGGVLFTSTKCVFEMACLYTLIGLKNCTYFDFSLICSIAIVIEGGWKTVKCGNQSKVWAVITEVRRKLPISV